MKFFVCLVVLAVVAVNAAEIPEFQASKPLPQRLPLRPKTTLAPYKPRTTKPIRTTYAPYKVSGPKAIVVPLTPKPYRPKVTFPPASYKPIAYKPANVPLTRKPIIVTGLPSAQQSGAYKPSAQQSGAYKPSWSA